VRVGCSRLSGRPPFYDDTPQGVLLRIKAADYDFPGTEWDYVSPEGLRSGLRLLLRQALQLNPVRARGFVSITAQQPRI